MLTELEVQEIWMPSYDDLHNPDGTLSKGKALIPVQVLKKLCDLALIGLKSSTKTPKTPSDCTKNADFMAFWAAWPKKQAREDAYKAWKALLPPLDAVLDALKWQRQQEGWLKDNGAYIPLPATYLRGKRWLDDRPGWSYKEEVKAKHVHAYKPIPDGGGLGACQCGDRQWITFQGAGRVDE